MKINKTIVVSLLAGVIIGGVTIGVLDANRPTPLFSSAMMMEPGENVCPRGMTKTSEEVGTGLYYCYNHKTGTIVEYQGTPHPAQLQ